ncbi:MAG: hypothetical protein L0209_01670 [candidate division Zixibacteria bacterium]|nr:hypothetical protein [candidate division Zixibacteria bacterium]
MFKSKPATGLSWQFATIENEASDMSELTFPAASETMTFILAVVLFLPLQAERARLAGKGKELKDLRHRKPV